MPGTSFQVGTTGNKVSLVLQNSDEIKVIQLKAVCSTPGVILHEVLQGSRTLGQGWTVSFHSVSDGRLNVLIANFGSEVFRAGEGPIAEIIFDLRDSIAGEFFTLRLEEVIAADPQGRKVELMSGDEAAFTLSDEVKVDFVVQPIVISLSLANRTEISKLQFKAKLDGVTAIAEPVLRDRAEGMQLLVEHLSNSLVVVLESTNGSSIGPGSGEILNIPIHSSSAVHLVVEDVSLVGSDNTVLESRVNIVGSSLKPELFVLHQNYPNPFNPSTIIVYELRFPMHVTLKVYNVLGQKVATIARGEQPAGSYAVRWNGPNDQGDTVASGTYLYSLTAGGSNVTKRMVFLK